MKKFFTYVGLTLLSALQAESLEILQEQPIFQTASFPSCHASTIIELPDGELFTAWFGGTKESAKDVAIWTSRYKENQWSTPELIASGGGIACWNPVLFRYPDGEILLFYRIGTSPRTWETFLKRSFNNGKTWSKGEKIPEGMLGPIKNKPILDNSGNLLCPSSIETKEGDNVWLERTTDRGLTFTKVGPIDPPTSFNRIIQPTIYFNHKGDLIMLIRPRTTMMNIPTSMRKILATVSQDGGETFSPAFPLDLPNHDSGFDATALHDGRILLVFNHSDSNRSSLAVAVSNDGINDWEVIKTLEKEDGEEFSYPAVIQDSQGVIHVTYTYKRKTIKHVALQLASDTKKDRLKAISESRTEEDSNL